MVLPRPSGHGVTISTSQLAFERVTLRIQARSHQEKQLAGALLRRRALALPSNGIGLAVHPGPLAKVLVVEDGPAGPTARQGTVAAVGASPNAVATDTVVGAAVTDQYPAQPPPVAIDDHPVKATENVIHGPSGQGQRPPGPFDGLLEAFTLSSEQSGRPSRPLPPPSRFMVRVAAVSKPHRATKRDYDYFAELNAALAAKAQRSVPSGDE